MLGQFTLASLPKESGFNGDGHSLGLESGPVSKSEYEAQKRPLVRIRPSGLSPTPTQSRSYPCDYPIYGLAY